jgi:hypothetical protein
MIKYKCKTCGKVHDGIPTFGADKPAQYWDVPKDKINTDVELTSDICIIANRFFFVRGCIEIPVLNQNDYFEWGVWVSLSDKSFRSYIENYENKKRSHIGPFFGWLATVIPYYQATLNLKTMVHLRDNLVRPYIVVELSDHQLSIDQKNGINVEKVYEIYHFIMNKNE